MQFNPLANLPLDRGSNINQVSTGTQNQTDIAEESTSQMKNEMANKPTSTPKKEASLFSKVMSQSTSDAEPPSYGGRIVGRIVSFIYKGVKDLIKMAFSSERVAGSTDEHLAAAVNLNITKSMQKSMQEDIPVPSDILNRNTTDLLQAHGGNLKKVNAQIDNLETSIGVQQADKLRGVVKAKADLEKDINKETKALLKLIKANDIEKVKAYADKIGDKYKVENEDRRAPMSRAEKQSYVMSKVLENVVNELGDDKTLDLLGALFRHDLVPKASDKQEDAKPEKSDKQETPKPPQTFLRGNDFTSRLYTACLEKSLGTTLNQPIQSLISEGRTTGVAAKVKANKDAITQAKVECENKIKENPSQKAEFEKERDEKTQALQNDDEIKTEYLSQLDNLVTSFSSMLENQEITPYAGRVSSLLEQCVNERFPGEGKQSAAQNFFLRAVCPQVAKMQPAKEAVAMSVLVQKLVNDASLGGKDPLLSFMDEGEGLEIKKSQIGRLLNAVPFASSQSSETI